MQGQQDRLRELWKIYFRNFDKCVRESRPHPPFPEVLRGLTCGAKTRKGTPCKRKDLYSSGRCKFHGGMSTGPTTEAGKKKVAENGRKSTKKRSEDADPMKAR